jgi:hypothetical protein
MDVTILYPLNMDELKRVFAEELAEALAYRYVYMDHTLRYYIYSDPDNIYIFVGAVKNRIAEEILRSGIEIDMDELRKKLHSLIKSHSISSFANVRGVDLTDRGVEIKLSISLGHMLRVALGTIAHERFLKKEIIERYKSVYEEERDKVLRSMRGRLGTEEIPGGSDWL